MFSKIGTLFTTISGLITGNYQSTLAAIIQFVLPAANLPANIENAISTVILAVVFAVMHKQNVVTAFLAAGASIILILQWAANFFPSISPFHAPLVMISAAFMALMQDKTAHSATGAPVS